jgi:hypothetical protein
MKLLIKNSSLQIKKNCNITCNGNPLNTFIVLDFSTRGLRRRQTHCDSRIRISLTFVVNTPQIGERCMSDRILADKDISEAVNPRLRIFSMHNLLILIPTVRHAVA